MIVWDWIILFNNQIVEISVFGGDELGWSGRTGIVDSCFGMWFGLVVLILLIGVLFVVVVQNIEDEIVLDVFEGIGEDFQDSV